MLVFAAIVVLISGTTAIFNHFSVNSTFAELRDEINAASLQDDIVSLVGSVLNRTQPSCVAMITDSIYKSHFDHNKLDSSLEGKLIYIMSVKDSESFEDEPAQEVRTLLMKIKDQNCELYVILITNGIQMASFLRYGDYHRLLNTRANIIMLHDYRLFTPDLHYVWKRIVNVIFVRKCDMKHGKWYEISTVPFPARIQDIFVSQVVNFWSPKTGFRWKKKNFNEKSNRHLNGVKLNVAVLQHTPTVYKQGYDYFGLEIDLVNTLSSSMNFTIDFYEPPDAEREKWGRNVGTANFSGLLGEMDEARADIALGDLHNTLFHLKVMDLSLPYNTECLTFITPEVLSDNSWKTLISPFSLGMWIGVLVSLFVSGVVFFSFSKVYVLMKDMRRLKHANVTAYFARDFFDDFSACILYTYSMILVVSLPRLPLRWSVRMLTGWWWIYCVLVVVAYRASLTSILANPQPRLTIDSLEVLANSWLKCGAWGEQNKNFFLMSSDQAAQKIGGKLEHVDDADDAIARVAQGDFAYFENQYTLQKLRFEQERQQKGGVKNLHIMEQCAINIPISIGLEKNSPLKEQIDKNIQSLIEGGLIKKWLMSATKSFESSIEAPPTEALMDLKKFYGALVALGCGYVLALAAFAAEKAYWRFVVEKHPNYDKYYGSIKVVSKGDAIVKV